MTKFWVLAAIAITVLGITSIGPLKTSAHFEKHDIVRAASPVPNRYIVLLSEDSIAGDALAPQVEAVGYYLTNLYGGSVKEVFSDAVKGFVVEMSEKQAQEMNSDPGIKSIEEDGYISISGTQTGAQWNLDRVDQRNMPLDNNYSYSSTGAGVHVYILDTGIRASHVEFGGRASVAADFVGDGQNGFDCNGHGTHVAGIVGSSTWGVAKGAFLHGVRVMQCDGNGQISTLLSGVNWVTANAVKPAVVNISAAAAGSSPALETGVVNSINSGVTYVIASGNGNWDACNFTPARIPSAITVGASDETDLRARYSNYGACIDLFAPGNLIVSTWSSSDTATNNLSGSSMAAPMAAGAAALYLSLNPNASAATVANTMKSTATAGVLTTNDPTSPNLLLYSWMSSGPASTPTPTPTPTATPTPTPTVTPTPTPAPASARVTVKKRLNNTTSTTSSVAFPYSASRLASPSFALTDNTAYQDTNVQSFGWNNPIVVTESPVDGYQLSAISCTETVNGVSTTPDVAVDLANRTATIAAQPGADILCTYTSDPLVPTAGGGYVAGRVTDAYGRGARGVVLTLYDVTEGRSVVAITNTFGYYSFQDQPVSHYYVLTISDNKRWTSPSPTRSFTLMDNLGGQDFFVQRN